MIKLLLYVSVFACMSGCRHSCTNAFLLPAFIGFSQNDLDTIVVRSYQPNDNYQHLLDTFLIVKNVSCFAFTFHDTTILDFVNFNTTTENIASGSDWQIYIPARNRTISISDIISEQTEGSRKICLNPITSFMQDGKVVTPHFVISSVYYTSGYFAYIADN
jgi:hypothetical protein